MAHNRYLEIRCPDCSHLLGGPSLSSVVSACLTDSFDTYYRCGTCAAFVNLTIKPGQVPALTVLAKGERIDFIRPEKQYGVYEAAWHQPQTSR